MKNPYATFVKDQVLALLKELNPETKALWGVMSVQHMVEHLNLIFAISNGKIQMTTDVDPAKLAYRKMRFFEADKPMPRFIPIPGVSAEEPLDLRYPDIETALAKLEKQINLFWEYFDKNKEVSELHPVLGPLNFEEWTAFHARHCRHHLAQFGVLADDAVLVF